jgi:hypothetical protein
MEIPDDTLVPRRRRDNHRGGRAGPQTLASRRSNPNGRGLDRRGPRCRAGSGACSTTATQARSSTGTPTATSASPRGHRAGGVRPRASIDRRRGTGGRRRDHPRRRPELAGSAYDSLAIALAFGLALAIVVASVGHVSDVG